MLRLAALSYLYRQVRSQRSFHFLGQLLKYKVVRLAQQSLQFFVSENAESLKRDPLIARHVRRGIYSLLFNQLVEFLFGTLEGHDIFRRPFQDHHRKHLAADLENEVVAPLHILSRVWKRKTMRAHRFTIQLLCSVYEESGERKRRPLRNGPDEFLQSRLPLPLL